MLTSHLGISRQAGEVACVLIRLAQTGDMNNLITLLQDAAGSPGCQCLHWERSHYHLPIICLFAHSFSKGAVWSLAVAQIKQNLRDLNTPAWAYANAYR